MKYFFFSLAVTLTVLIVLLSFVGVAVLINSFGNIGFFAAPIFSLIIVSILIGFWIKFFKYLTKGNTK
jgi:uncharacterized membrane protein YdcZ (DUF606 family)